MNPAPYAEINLAALRHNLAKVRQLAPQAKIMAVIKANAYGHGMVRIASTLEDADAFAVARLDEGIQLRQVGIQQKILVLQGFNCAKALSEMLTHQLDAVVHHPHQVDLLEHNQNRHKLAIWLKIDTGMNRLGFKPEQVQDAYQRLQNLTCIQQPINLMTHLASADDPVNKFTAQQIKLFQQLTSHYPGQRSVANSAGIIEWQDSISDWVRPGLMLYGISPFVNSTGVDLDLQPVMSLHSQLIAIKTVNADETVGYSNTWRCDNDTLLGIVAVGYGDGYPRYAKPGTPVLVNGMRVPLIGRVSMDMIAVDLTSQPNTSIGDKVTLWGDALAVEEIAMCAETIPYTLVCGLTQRVRIVEI